MYADNLKREQLVPHFLMHSYLYYIRLQSIITDAEYDKLCKRLSDEWEGVTHHHKHLIDREALRAGTGFYLKETDYPLISRCTALTLSDFYQQDQGDT